MEQREELPPGYGPRPLRYPKLEPYIQTIDRLLHDTISFPPGANLTIRDIVEHLRRDEGFAGSYDSVKNYIRQRARDDESAWGRAYAYFHWEAMNRITFRHTEVSLASEQYAFGGTLDAVGMIGNELILLDWK